MKKLLSLLSVIGIASSGSIVIANPTNTKQVNRETPEIIEVPKEEQTGPEISTTDVKASEAITKIKNTAEKQTYKSIDEAVAEIEKEALTGTVISLKESKYITSEQNKTNGIVHLRLEVSLKENYVWDNESLENTIIVSTTTKIDERTNVSKEEVLDEFEKLARIISATTEKVEHKNYFKSENEALLEILQTQFEYGQVINAEIKSDKSSEEVVINEDVSFEVEVLLDKNHKWLEETKDEKAMSLNTFNFDLRIDERKEASFKELNDDIISKLGKNSDKFYSEQEALDAIEKYKKESNITSLKDAGVSLIVLESEKTPETHSIYDKEYKIEAKIDDKIYKWSDETIESKEIKLITLIDSRIEVKQTLIQETLEAAVNDKVFATKAELIHLLLNTTLEEGATISSVDANVVEGKAQVNIHVIIDGEYRWDDEDDNNKPKTFTISSKVFDNRVYFDDVSKELKDAFLTKDFASKEEIEAFAKEQKINGVEIVFVNANGSQEKGWIISLTVTPSEGMIWNDGTNSSQKLMLTAKATN